MQFPSWDQRQNKPKVQIVFKFSTSCFIHVSEFCPFVSRPLPQVTTKKSTSDSLVGTNAAGNPIFFMRNSIYTVHIHFKGIIFIAILNIVIIQIICHDCHQKNEVDDQRWRRRRTSVADSRTDRWLSILLPSLKNDHLTKVWSISQRIGSSQRLVPHQDTHR